MIANQRQALDARLKQFRGEGTIRSAAPGTIFTLADHPEHDLDLPEQRKFLITAVTYEARNALEANATVDSKNSPKTTPATDPVAPHRHGASLSGLRSQQLDKEASMISSVLMSIEVTANRFARRQMKNPIGCIRHFEAKALTFVILFAAFSWASAQTLQIARRCGVLMQDSKVAQGCVVMRNLPSGQRKNENGSASISFRETQHSP